MKTLQRLYIKKKTIVNNTVTGQNIRTIKSQISDIEQYKLIED